MQIITLEEFRARSQDSQLPVANWGGWTTVDRDPAKNYQNVRQTFLRTQVHEDDFLFFSNFDKEAGLFLDVGANMGFSAISFRNVNRSMRVVSFEIIPFLEDVLRMISFDVPNFEFRMTGVSDTTGSAKMYVPVHGNLLCTPLASLTLDNFTPDHRHEAWRRDTGADEFELVEMSVQLIAIDDLYYHPFAIKIDVEGAEMLALRGMEQTLLRAKPIVMCEKNEDLTFVNWMKNRAFRCFTYNPQANSLFEFPSGPIPGLNAFFIHREKIRDVTSRGIHLEIC